MTQSKTWGKRRFEPLHYTFTEFKSSSSYVNFTLLRTTISFALFIQIFYGVFSFSSTYSSRWSLITPRLLTSCWSPTQRWRLTMTMTNIPSDLEETPPIKCLHCLHCCHCVHYFHYFNCLHWLHSGICAYIHCYMVRALAHNGLWDLFGVRAGWMGS